MDSKPYASERDPRHIFNGHRIPAVNYVDQPYVVLLPDRSWLCVLTTGAGHEGHAGQHVTSIRSYDQGKSWTDPIAIEPPTGPEASWAVPLHVPDVGGPLGRVYAFYVYNRDNLRQVPSELGLIGRVDTLGYYVFRYSDDGGQTWSTERYQVPVREFQMDRDNPTHGEVRYFWSVCKPYVHHGSVYIGIHKVGNFGDGFMKPSEGAFVVSDNILSEADPTQLRWLTLPDGDIGLRATYNPVADEQNLTGLTDGTLFCVYRTTEGHPCHAYSRDGGHSWTPPAHMTYGPGKPKVKHPRAANFVRRFSNGQFLYWFHNHSNTWYDGRNPAWLLGGREVETPEGRRIAWSQPEIVLYDGDIATRMSYPDFVEQNGQIFITETQKHIARTHEVPPEILDWLWEGPQRAELARDGLQVEASGASEIALPTFAPLWRERAGFSLDFEVRFDDLTPFQCLFDARNEAGEGVTVFLTDRGTLKITLCGGLWAEHIARLGNGRAESSWECDPGLFQPHRWHHITAIVDGGPKLILWVIDGRLCDGGETRPFGWGRFHPNLDDVNAAPAAQLAPTLRGELGAFRLYGRALRVNEAASNHRAAH